MAREFRLVEKWQLVINLSLGIIGIIALCIYRGQLEQMKISVQKMGDATAAANRSAIAAETANNQARTQFRMDQRPYVWFTGDLGPFQIAPGAPHAGQVNGKLAFNFRFTNYGKSPAINCQVDARIGLGEKVEANIKWRNLDATYGAILPPGKVDYNTAWSDNVVDASLLARINTPGVIEHVIVYGHFQYSDMYGTIYTSEFCIGHSPSGAVSYCKEHNQIK